ncbi:MAG: YdbH domain-containing protein [Planctomycetes bacterium]|nr:YdbH domain-containing protein [Planctomycetota bacterium]
MSKKRRWKRILAVLAFLPLFFCVTLYFSAPAILKNVLHEEFADMGIAEVSFRVESVGLDSAIISDFAVGEAGMVSAKKIIASYTLSSLYEKRINSLNILSPSLRFVVRDGKPELGALSGYKSSGGEIPVDDITIENLGMEIVWDGKSHREVTDTAEIKIVDASNVEISASSRSGISLHSKLNISDLTGTLVAQHKALDVAALRKDLPHLDAILRNANIGTGWFYADIKWDGRIVSGRASIEGVDRHISATQNISGIDISFHGKACLIDGTADISDAKNPVVDAKVEVRDVTVNVESFGLGFEGLSGDFPFTWGKNRGVKASSNGTFKAKKVRIGDIDVPDTSVSGRVDGMSGRFEASSEAFPGVRIESTIDLSYAEGMPSAKILVNAKPFDAGKIKDIGKRIPYLTGLAFDGEVSLGGGLDYKNEKWIENLFVKVKDVSAKSKLLDAEISGMIGAIPICEDPKSAMELNIKQLRLGDLYLYDGRLNLFGTYSGGLRINDSTFKGFDGTIGCEKTSVDFLKHQAEVKLKFDKVSLGKLLEFAAVGRAEGEGRFSGWWDIHLSWSPELDITFGEGELISLGKGWFRIKEEEDASALLESAKTGKGGIQDEIVAKIERALLDFEFDEMTISMIKNADGSLTTAIKTKGRGPRGDNALPFGGLNFKINGLDDLLHWLIIRSPKMKTALDMKLRKGLTESMPAGKDKNSGGKSEEQVKHEEDMKKALEMFF